RRWTTGRRAGCRLGTRGGRGCVPWPTGPTRTPGGGPGGRRPTAGTRDSRRSWRGRPRGGGEPPTVWGRGAKAPLPAAPGRGEEAVALLRRAQGQHPGDFWLNHDLAYTLAALPAPRLDEAVGYYRAALALRPDSPGVHLNLGYALHAKGDHDGAIASFRAAL